MLILLILWLSKAIELEMSSLSTIRQNMLTQFLTTKRALSQESDMTIGVELP